MFNIATDNATVRLIKNEMTPSAAGRSFSGHSILVNAHYGSLRQYELNSEDEFLKTTVSALMRPGISDLLVASSLLSTPELREKIGAALSTNRLRPIETNVPLMTYSAFRDSVVHVVVSSIAPDASLAVKDLITYIFGHPAVKAGFVVAEAATKAVVRSMNMFPDYAALRQRLVARLVYTYVKKYDMTISIPASKRISSTLLFRSMIDDLHGLARDLITVSSKTTRFDEIAALALLRSTADPLYLTDPALAPLMEMPEVVQFSQNLTLLYAANHHFTSIDAVRARIPAAGIAALNAREYDGLVDMISTHDDLKRITIDELHNRTDLMQFTSIAGRPVAYAVAPKVKQSYEAAVSFIPPRTPATRVVLTPMKAAESQLQSLGDAVFRLIDRPLLDFKALLGNVSAGGLDPLEVDFSLTNPDKTRDYAPSVFFYGFQTKEQEQYLWYLAVAAGARVVWTEAKVDALTVFDTVFEFVPTIRDAIGYLQMINGSTAVAVDPALVLLYTDLVDGSSIATDAWVVREPSLSKASRSCVLTDHLENPLRAISPDTDNHLDRNEKLLHRFSSSTDDMVHEGSVYDWLSGGAQTPSAAPSMIAHDHFMSRLSLDTHLQFLTTLYKLAIDSENDSAAHQVSTVAAILFADLLKAPVVRMAARVVLSSMIRTISDPVLRLAARASVNDPLQTQSLRMTVLLVMLHRANLLSYDVRVKLMKSELLLSRRFAHTLASLLPAEI